ncbi:MAG: adenine phosphoribosyltransferase [Spirochaetia bacterium]|nr:adenine phosphoribosyltransferase [Spirochaetia bacterium]
MEHAIRSLIRNIPDFPKPGIQFKDITPVLSDKEALKTMIEWFKISIEAAGEIELVVGIESRGFIIGSALAHEMNVGFVPIRKPGKLPFDTESASYELEYGEDSVEIHIDAVHQGQKVALVDDLLATGGTAEAAFKLLSKLGADVVASAFLIELDDLKGRKRLKSLAGDNIYSLIHY